MKKDNVLTIFTRIRQRLHTTARNIAGQNNADDVLQDAFCKLWTLKKYPNDQQQTENITNSIVRNLSIDYRRAANRSVLSDIDTNDTDNSKEQDIRELFDSVKKIIDLRLNDTQRNVLWLRDYEGYSFEEIAKKTGRTEANVRQILSRARKVIRETYKTIN